MIRKNLFGLFIFGILISSCSTPKESVMPFRNLVYSGQSIFPIQSSDSEWVFRAWINNGTSIDRIITLSSDSTFGVQSFLDEIGTLSKKHNKKESVYYRKALVPKSGFDNFIHKIDSLNLLNYKNQENFEYKLNHQPFSLYVIEIKVKDKYNQFSFRTHFPSELEVDKDKYEWIQHLLFDEFNYTFYVE